MQAAFGRIEAVKDTIFICQYASKYGLQYRELLMEEGTASEETDETQGGTSQCRTTVRAAKLKPSIKSIIEGSHCLDSGYNGPASPSFGHKVDVPSVLLQETKISITQEMRSSISSFVSNLKANQYNDFQPERQNQLYYKVPLFEVKQHVLKSMAQTNDTPSFYDRGRLVSDIFNEEATHELSTEPKQTFEEHSANENASEANS